MLRLGSDSTSFTLSIKSVGRVGVCSKAARRTNSEMTVSDSHGGNG